MEPKYLEIAQQLEMNILSGNWKRGDRIPSVRQMSRELAVSIGTVVHSYEVLEGKGLISSRDRSGYYVSEPGFPSLKVPETGKFEGQPQEIKILETAIQVMSATQYNTIYPLGGAIPNCETKALGKLNRIIKSTAGLLPNQYEGPLGSRDLRRQIARRSFTTGRSYGEDELILTSGSQQSLALALQVTTQPGDLVAVESPGYYGLLQCLEVLKRPVLEIRVSPESGMDMDHLEFQLKRYPVKALVLNPNFSNPTGVCYSQEKKQFISSLIDRLDIPLIEDDVFSDLCHGENRPRTIHSYNQQERVLLCSSFSKTLSQDLRVGWLEPGRYFKEARAFKYATTIGNSSLQQWAMAEFLEGQDYHRHLRKVRRLYGERLHHFLMLVEKYFPKGTKVTHPDGGFLCWLKLPGDVNSLNLYRRAMKQGISITPGALFSPTDRYRSYIRLSFSSIPLEDMDLGMERLSLLI